MCLFALPELSEGWPQIIFDFVKLCDDRRVNPAVVCEAFPWERQLCVEAKLQAMQQHPA